MYVHKRIIDQINQPCVNDHLRDRQQYIHDPLGNVLKEFEMLRSIQREETPYRICWDGVEALEDKGPIRNWTSSLHLSTPSIEIQH